MFWIIEAHSSATILATLHSLDVANIETVKDCEFVVFKSAIEAGGTVRGLNVKGQGDMPRKKIDAVVNRAKEFGAKGLAWITYMEDGMVVTHRIIELVTAEDGSKRDYVINIFKKEDKINGYKVDSVKPVYIDGEFIVCEVTCL